MCMKLIPSAGELVSADTGQWRFLTMVRTPMIAERPLRGIVLAARSSQRLLVIELLQTSSVAESDAGSHDRGWSVWERVCGHRGLGSTALPSSS